jgi:protein O-GlcNAc transferase
MKRGEKRPGLPGAAGQLSWQGLKGNAAGRPDPLATAYQRGLELHRAGNLVDAGKRYQEVLAVNPHHAEAQHSLGLVFHQMGKHDQAERHLQRAVAAAPANPAFHSSLGMAQAAMGRPADAVKSFRAALRRDPDSAQLNANLGTALLELGQPEEAAQVQRRALRQRPDMARAHAGLGRALAAMARLVEAEASLRRAFELSPDYADAQLWLADLLMQQGRLDEAVANFSAAAATRPNHPATHLGLASAFATLGRHQRAADNFRAAVYFEPSAAAYLGLGRQLIALQQPAEALEALRMAQRLAPLDVEITTALEQHLANLGQADEPTAPVRELSELEREEARFRMAVAVTPGNAVALGNLANSLGALGRLEEAVDYNRQALAAQPDYFYAWSNLLFSINYLGHLPIAEMVAEARRFGAAVEARFPARTAHANIPDPARRLRIGFVSADLRSHPVGRFLAAPLAAIDPARLDLFAYSDTRRPDDLTASLKSSFATWRVVVGLDDETLERLILADEIDILVDLSGHSGDSRLPLFARKPAPIAVTWLGYFATTGLTTMDYVLATRWVIPESETDQWVEKPWYMPETYLCFSPPQLHVPLVTPPMLHNGYVTFGSANNINKLNAETAACWAGVLKAVPDSRLLLRSQTLSDPPVADKVAQQFAAFGIPPERLILQGAVSNYAQHLARYGDVDIALDPFPYSGGTTTMESLWMGVPVLTLKGDRYVAHMGENILHNLGMSEWIATDTAAYATKAASFAADPKALAALRQNLRHRVSTSPLTDAPRFARAMEAAFRGMWEEWCTGQG